MRAIIAGVTTAADTTITFRETATNASATGVTADEAFGGSVSIAAMAEDAEAAAEEGEKNAVLAAGR